MNDTVGLIMWLGLAVGYAAAVWSLVRAERHPGPAKAHPTVGEFPHASGGKARIAIARQRRSAGERGRVHTRGRQTG